MENKEMGSTVIYVLAGVLLAFLINSGMGLALGTDLPIVAVQSNSMVPTFFKGDMLMLQGYASAEDVHIGDIIVFVRSEITRPEESVPIVHRVIKINEDGTFQTKGDANTGQLAFETKILFDNIRGKVLYIVPYLGWVKIGFTDYVFPPIVGALIFALNNIIWVVLIVVVTAIIIYKYRGSI